MHIHDGYQIFSDKNPVKDVEHAFELQKKYPGKNFAIDSIKILLDGVLESKTAYLCEPYSDKNDNYRGMLRFDMETLVATIKKANELGITVHIHTIGDGAVKFVLDAFEKANSGKKFRNAITHMQVIKPADFDTMAKLGVVEVANTFWFIKDPDYHEKLSIPFLGDDKCGV